MKGRTIILDEWHGQEAAALIVDGVLEDFIVENEAPTPGSIYRAIADRPIKGQGGMFLTTPDGNAFLRQIKGLRPGQPLLVQVTGYSEDGKAIPVTNKILFKSRYVIVTPTAPGLNISRAIRDDDRREEILALIHDTIGVLEFGMILRSSCAGAEDDAIVEDAEAMIELAQNVLADTEGPAELLVAGDSPHQYAWREWGDDAEVVTEAGGFEAHGVLDAPALLNTARIDLAGGASIYVEPTRAFVSVDVNTGNDTSLAAGLKANIAVARALPRVLRTRGLGGQVVIDPAPMPKKDRRLFETSLRAAFKADQVETNLVGWTTMGLYELQRQRARLPVKLGDV
jgi:Ribonuclease G/E